MHDARNVSEGHGPGKASRVRFEHWVPADIPGLPPEEAVRSDLTDARRSHPPGRPCTMSRCCARRSS
jgi:hypothetical protein